MNKKVLQILLLKLTCDSWY